MGERKGVNKYYPPDWDPSKGSINQYVGQHPLRDRARKISQGILIIRFEMPYNIWCGGCNSHIGMGVRYNAEKMKTGMYYSTPIYKFRMKCHLCDNYFEIQTDPKNHDYVILEGARRKEQRWDPKENLQVVTEDKAVQKKMATDAMYKLEHGTDDLQRGKKAVSSLGSLEVCRDEWKDDYVLNKVARQKFREEKKSLKAEVESDSALLVKSSLDIPLQKEAEEDVRLAKLIKYRTLESFDEKQVQKRKEIESRPLFDTPNKVSKPDSMSPDNKKLDIIKKQMKTARTSSPFDKRRMITVGLAKNRESLGIRKKCISSFSTKPQNEECGWNKSKEEFGSKLDGFDGSVVGNCLNNESDYCEVQRHSVNSGYTEKSLASDYLICTLCGKKLNQREGKMLSTCSCKSNSTTSHSSLNISHVSGTSGGTSGGISYTTDVKEINSDKMKTTSLGDQQNVSAGLGLLGHYSDTDSD